MTENRRGQSQYLSSKSDAVGAILDLTVRGLEASKDIITAAAPVPGLSAALDVTIELLGKIQDAKSNCKAFVALCEETRDLGETLESLAKTIDAELKAYPESSSERTRLREEVCGSSKLLERVKKLDRKLQMVRDQAERLGGRSPFRRFLHSSSDAEAVIQMKDTIAAAHRSFQVENEVTIQAILIESLSGIKRVIAAQKAEEEERILGSIPRADDAHYLSAANAMKARFQKDTRTQVFEALDAWVDGQATERHAKPICALVGEAGTGKSTIASEFSKRLQERGRLGASFFFTRGVQDLNSPKKFFSTVASQLARSQWALRIPVVDAAREHLKVAALQQLEHEFEDLLRKPLSLLPSSYPSIFVVVDALDECTEEGPQLAPALLRLLLSCSAQPGSPLRIFLTSRPEPHYIHKALAAPNLQPHIDAVSIQSFRSSIDRDIALLIRARFEEDEASKTWSEAEPTIVPRLVSLADGLFLYARTAVDFILGDPLTLQERYDLLTQGGTAFGVAGLDDLYRTVLESVFPPQEQYPQMKDRLKVVLGYLATIQDPDGLSPTTLEKLSGLPAAHSVPILSRLRSVVFFNRGEPASPFRIVHATFREFLLERGRSGLFCVDARLAHRRLAEDCLAAMRSFRMAHWQDTVGAALLFRLLVEPLPKQRGFPQVCYAAEYCTYHREHSSDDSSRDVLLVDDEIDTTLTTSIVYWWYRDTSDRRLVNDYHVIMWDMLRDVLARSRQSLSERSKPVVDALLTFRENIHQTDSHVHKVAQIAVLCILMDLEAVSSVAVAGIVQGRDTGNPGDLDEKYLEELAIDIRNVMTTPRFGRDSDIIGETNLLVKAYIKLHEAIVAAGLSSGPLFPDDLIEWLR